MKTAPGHLSLFQWVFASWRHDASDGSDCLGQASNSYALMMETMIVKENSGEFHVDKSGVWIRGIPESGNFGTLVVQALSWRYKFGRQVAVPKPNLEILIRASNTH